jgi:hypothetical protein
VERGLKRIEVLIDDLTETDDPDIKTATTFLLVSEADRLTRQLGRLDAVEHAIAWSAKRIARQQARAAAGDMEHARRATQILANTRRTLAELQEMRDLWGERIALGQEPWDLTDRRKAGYAAAAAVMRATA